MCAVQLSLTAALEALSLLSLHHPTHTHRQLQTTGEWGAFLTHLYAPRSVQHVVVAQEMEGEGEGKARGEASVHEGTCLGSSKSLANMKVSWRPQRVTPSHRSTACSGAGCLLAAGAGAGETPGYLSQPRLAMGRLESLGRAVRLSWPKSLTLAWESQAACKAPVTRCRGTGRVTASFRHLIPVAGTALASRVCFITRAAIRPVLAKR